ncbi:DUF6493 family protein [Actinoplanes sp. NPDC051861]|uniref:DUF6493 family protein n=1 Tax=Actinoplanes sp. NPDC051861 TaxID=3155170 RepID=UPI00344496D1
MTLSWEVLLRRASNGDHAGVTSLLLKADEAERLAFAAEVAAGIKGLDRDAWWQPPSHPAGGLLLAVLATAPSASAAAGLLTRRDMRPGWRSAPLSRVSEIAAARELTWLGDLGVRLAQKLPTRDTWATGDWQFTAALLAAGGTEPPVTEGYVRGWLLHLLRPAWGENMPSVPLADRLRDDPHLEVLLPGIFEFDGLGADIGGTAWNEETQSYDTTPRLPGAIAALVAEGHTDRATVLTATIDRLVRGDKPHALRPFAVLHDALAPTAGEMAPFAPGYSRLLGEAPGAVATLGQKALRAVDDAGRLELETLLDASSAALLRKEKTLVKAQLTWLERVARREPARAGDVYEAIAVAFGHPALDIQERALAIVEKAQPSTIARLAPAATALGGDLPARAAALFGSAAATPGPATPAPPAPVPVAPMPAPITDAAELAEEIVLLVHGGTAVGWERVLAALVALTAAGEPPADALTPVLDRHPGSFEEHSWNEGSPLLGLGTAIRPVSPTLERMTAAVAKARDEGRRDFPLSTLPTGVLGLRAAEIAANVAAGSVPMLVATPTHVNGNLDAAELAARLGRAEAEGWQPWHFDLEQALLRVPRGADPAVAAGLTSPAGRRFADWLAGGGLPDPVSTAVTQTGEKNDRGEYTWDLPLGRRIAASLRPAREDGLRLTRQLLTHEPEEFAAWMPDDFSGSEDVLTMVLPHHREVAAAWALPEIATLADQDQKGAGVLLPLLADCSGPVGPAMAYAMAYAFGAKQESDRSAAVDAFLTLAAGTEPFAGAVGAAFADLCSDTTVKLGRAVPALTDAHRAGASAAVWELLTAALPPLLTTRVRAVPDLLQLATQVAVALGTTEVIPGLAEVAARHGSARLVLEARRLLTTTGGPA